MSVIRRRIRPLGYNRGAPLGAGIGVKNANGTRIAVLHVDRIANDCGGARAPAFAVVALPLEPCRRCCVVAQRSIVPRADVDEVALERIRKRPRPAGQAPDALLDCVRADPLRRRAGETPHRLVIGDPEDGIIQLRHAAKAPDFREALRGSFQREVIRAGIVVTLERVGPEQDDFAGIDNQVHQCVRRSFGRCELERVNGHRVQFGDPEAGRRWLEEHEVSVNEIDHRGAGKVEVGNLRYRPTRGVVPAACQQRRAVVGHAHRVAAGNVPDQFAVAIQPGALDGVQAAAHDVQPAPDTVTRPIRPHARRVHDARGSAGIRRILLGLHVHQPRNGRRNGPRRGVERQSHQPMSQVDCAPGRCDIEASFICPVTASRNSRS